MGTHRIFTDYKHSTEFYMNWLKGKKTCIVSALMALASLFHLLAGHINKSRLLLYRNGLCINWKCFTEKGKRAGPQDE